MGGPLATRHPAGVHLTEAGTLLAEHARTLLARADQSLLEVRSHTSGAYGQLRIGIFEQGFAELTTPVLAAFRAAHPHVRVSIRTLDFTTHTQALTDDEVDVVLARPPIHDQRVHLEPMFTEPQAVSLHAHHDLAAAPAVRVADLLDEPFVVFPDHPQLDRWVGYWRLDPHRNGERARTADHQPSSVREVNELVALGWMATGTAASTARFSPHPGVRQVPIADAEGSTAAVAALRGVSHPLISAFTDVARHVVADNIALVPGAVLSDRSAHPPRRSVVA